jgi:hypothetical protein
MKRGRSRCIKDGPGAARARSHRGRRMP